MIGQSCESLYEKSPDFVIAVDLSTTPMLSFTAWLRVVIRSFDATALVLRRESSNSTTNGLTEPQPSARKRKASSHLRRTPIAKWIMRAHEATIEVTSDNEH